MLAATEVRTAQVDGWLAEASALATQLVALVEVTAAATTQVVDREDSTGTTVWPTAHEVALDEATNPVVWSTSQIAARLTSTGVRVVQVEALDEEMAALTTQVDALLATAGTCNVQVVARSRST